MAVLRARWRVLQITDVASDDAILGLRAGAISARYESQAPGVRSYKLMIEQTWLWGTRGEGVFNIEVLGFSL